jgi:diguanylate cyclase (GGDEF)-like protein
MPEAKQTDPLTGTLTHQAFLEAFGREAARAREEGGGLSLGLVDLDHFKGVNDEHGREAGDEVLRVMTRHVADAVSGQGTLFRYGGDEFLVLLPGVEKEQAFLLLEQARSAFGREHALAVGTNTITVPLAISIGVASFPEDGSRAQEILRKAGDAMYRAKARGGNSVCLAREERMVTKTSHYTQGQLERLSALAKREGVGEAVLLREALDDLLRKYTL